jgi:hypothetical protein
MKITLSSRPLSAFSLVTSLVFLGIASATLGSILLWTTQTALLSRRNGEYHTTIYVGESVFQKIRSSIVNTFQNADEPSVYLRLGTYPAMLPTAADDTISATYGVPNGIGGSTIWGSYSYLNPANSRTSALVSRVSNNVMITLDPPFSGLTASAAKYQVITTVANSTSPYQLPVNVGVELTLGNIPLFQYSMFSEGDLELNPGAAMVISGLLHGNSDIYITGGSVTFSNDVSATGSIFMTRKPGDPSGTTLGTIRFLGSKATNQPYQHLPTGTNQSETVSDLAASVHAILDIPDESEPYGYNSVGTNRYYNKADLIIKMTDSGVQAYSARYRGTSTLLTNFSSNIVGTESFYDQREATTMQATTFNVGNFKKYLESTNESAQLNDLLGAANFASTVYIVDLRSTSGSTVSTNYNYTTNYTTNVVTNTITASTTASIPASYIAGTLITNGASSTTTSSTKPATNSVIVNSVSYNTFTRKYTYRKIAGFTYQAYSTSSTTSTNTIYTTNTVELAKPAIVLTNGTVLPTNGLTIATLDPVYIRGDYNVSLDGVTLYKTTSDTSHSRPAAVLADAITILSTNFTAANSTKSLSSRIAATTTVNAGLLSGNVPTVAGHYSGGFENFTRFLEDWSGKSFYYNGSMVMMFPSQIATGYWPSTGSVYQPPTRYWTYDYNFIGGKLPPSSPQVTGFARGKWRVLAPGDTLIQQ